MAVLATLTSTSRVALWGYGREGRATRRFLDDRLPGLVPTLVTDAPVAETGLPALAGGAGREAIATGAFDVVIKSPGISLYRSEVEAARRAGTILTSSTNLWFEASRSRFVLAVTGTKGKSTTASLIAHLWRGAVPAVALAGNVGVPLISLPPDGAPLVLELSSYQIADLVHAPSLMLLTNLFPEHLDWHRTHEAYYRDKLRLVDLASKAVLNAGDPRTMERLAARPDVCWYGTPEGWHATLEGACRGERLVVPTTSFPLRGAHNLANLAAACAALEAGGVDVLSLADRASTFAGLRHRLELLGEREGRLWVNDSISTTPESAAAAVRAFADRPLTLLLGGQERGQDAAPLVAALAGLNVRILAMPDNGMRMAQALRAAHPHLPIETFPDLEAAIARARDRTPQGGVVMLSPAAPSYGHFRDFEERGDAFRALAGFTTDA